MTITQKEAAHYALIGMRYAYEDLRLKIAELEGVVASPSTAAGPATAPPKRPRKTTHAASPTNGAPVTVTATPEETVKKRKPLSAEAREKIAEGQRKRWADTKTNGAAGKRRTPAPGTGAPVSMNPDLFMQA